MRRRILIAVGAGAALLLGAALALEGWSSFRRQTAWEGGSFIRRGWLVSAVPGLRFAASY